MFALKKKHLFENALLLARGIILRFSPEISAEVPPGETGECDGEGDGELEDEAVA